MPLAGLLLSCLVHVVLAWLLCQSDWAPVAAPSSSDVSQFVAFLQPVGSVAEVRSDNSLESLPTSSEPARPDVEPVAKPAPELPAPPEPLPEAAPPVVPSDSEVPQPRKRPEQQKQLARVESAAPPKAPTEARPPEVASAASSTSTPNPAPTAQPVPAQNAKPSRAAKSSQPNYAQRLTRRIEQHKSYPRRARQRGLSGEIRFDLSVDASGEMLAFHWLEGHQAFRHATLQAIRSALPYPPEPGQGEARVQIRMVYSLKKRM